VNPVYQFHLVFLDYLGDLGHPGNPEHRLLR
jgi:hypothetical protein